MVLGTFAVMANFLGTNLEGILCMAFMEMVSRSACFECSPERSWRNRVGVLPERVISTSLRERFKTDRLSKSGNFQGFADISAKVVVYNR